MLITHAPKGTEDLLPQDSYKWHWLEKKFKKVCDCYGYREIRFPTFEHTELFERGVGDTTDVVQKQMYTFNDKGGRSITLRPEGTSSVARSFLEHNQYAEALPFKAFYNVPCFRYENKQKGRLREFHQFGVEAIGSYGPSIDAEIVSLALSFLNDAGLSDLSVNINSIGCPKCRQRYREVLKDFLRPKYDELCDTCKSRFERNPLRILDCKSEICQSLVKGAPVLLDYICEDCSKHFDGFKHYLDLLGVGYTVDPGIVRGLDYYTKTVFEFVSNSIGAQGTVCGGGRYDGLVEELGGQHTASLGFAMGLERLMLLMEAQGCEFPQAEKPDLFIVALGEKATLKAVEIAKDMREEGFSALLDLNQRSVRAQMKYADKLGAKFNVVIGDNEVENKIAKIKNMQTGEETEINLDTFVSGFYNISLNDQLADLEINGEEFDFGSLFGLKNSEEE